ncbi:MAG: DeoR/GlpR family DNA-binding transcription regulator [Planctomycetota bacterium]
MSVVRHDKILEMVARGGEVSVDRLARRFDLSRMTVRRDLAALARAGRLSRTHGGAVASRTGLVEFSFRDRENHRLGEKRAIARAVAARIRPGMTVSLDTGTTTREVARALVGIRGITVLTSSLAIAALLYANEGCEVVLPGGVVRRTSPDLTGSLAEETLRNFRVDLAVIGADAAAPGGIFTRDVGVSRICRAMVARAAEVVLVADSGKFATTAFVHSLDWKDVDRVVTDDGCSPAVRRWLGRKVGKVTYVAVARGRGKC